MTETSNQLLREVEPGLLPKHTVLLPIALTALDRIITVAYWQHESNPLVSSLGVEKWLMLSIVLVGGMLGVWYVSKAYRLYVAQVTVLVYAAFMLVVVLGNVWYVFG